MRESGWSTRGVACWIVVWTYGTTPSHSEEVVDPVPEPAAEVLPADEEDEDWDRLLLALHVLETGSREEKLEVLEPDDDGAGPFWCLDEPPDDDVRATREAVERLRDYVRSERDDWVLDRVATSLAATAIEDATPVFLDLTRHPAPSVRHRAMEYFAGGGSSLDETQDLALLEGMWNQEQPPWLRATLLEALVRAQSATHVEECPGLLWHADIDLATAAIHCMSRNATPDSLMSLVRRAKLGDPILRREALTALFLQAGKTDLRPILQSLEALAQTTLDPWFEVPLLALLEAAGSEAIVDLARARVWHASPEVASAAIAILGMRATPETVPLLVQRAREGADDLRVTAIGVLDRAVVVPEVEALFAESLSPGQPRAVRLAVVNLLNRGRNFGEPALRRRERFRTHLSAVAGTDPDEEVREAAEIDDEGMRVLTCGGSRFQAPSKYIAQGADGGSSLRCHDGPYTESPPVRARRVSAGTLVGEYDRFDDGRSLWILIEPVFDDACWVPADLLARIEPGVEEAVPDESSIEFDLPLEATRTESFLALEGLGVLAAFDRGATLAGVRWTLDVHDEEAIEGLRGAVEWAHTRIGEIVRSLVPTLDTSGSRDGWDAWWRSDSSAAPAW